MPIFSLFVYFCESHRYHIFAEVFLRTFWNIVRRYLRLNSQGISRKCVNGNFRFNFVTLSEEDRSILSLDELPRFCLDNANGYARFTLYFIITTNFSSLRKVKVWSVSISAIWVKTTFSSVVIQSQGLFMLTLAICKIVTEKIFDAFNLVTGGMALTVEFLMLQYTA